MRSEAEVWQSSAPELTLSSGRIDIWRVQLDSPVLPEEELRGILARDELDRAFRFHFDRDRGRYMAGRAALRILLGRYLKMPPGEIRLQYQAKGKPELAPPYDSHGLRFNVSDSGGLALIAMGCGQELGIDVEKIREMPDLFNIARRFFSPREVEAILEVSAPRRQEAFFACWTRKESFLKATGSGLSYPLSKFSVSVDPDQAAEFWELEGKVDLARQWFLTDVFPGEGFRAALAYKGAPCRIAYWIFESAWVDSLT